MSALLCGCCLGTEHVSTCDRGHARIACCHRLKEIEGPCPACADEDTVKAAIAKEKAAKAAFNAAEKAANEKAAAAADLAAKIAAAAREKVIAELVAREQAEQAAKIAAEGQK